jgi:hypothetical protein
MLKNILLAFALTMGATIAFSTEASADHNCHGRRGYYAGYGGFGGAYVAPVYRAPVYVVPYSTGYRGYNSFYGAPYGVYGAGYRGYGGGFGYPYYGGTAIGIGRGGISLNFGF